MYRTFIFFNFQIHYQVKH